MTFALLDTIVGDTITVVSGHGIPFTTENAIIQIEDELIFYRLYNANTFYYCTRGYLSTTEVDHDQYVPIAQNPSLGLDVQFLNQFYGEDINLSDKYNFDFENGDLERVSGVDNFMQYVTLLGINVLSGVLESGLDVTTQSIQVAFDRALQEETGGRITKYSVNARQGQPTDSVDVIASKYSGQLLFLPPPTNYDLSIVVELYIMTPYSEKETLYKIGLANLVG